MFWYGCPHCYHLEPLVEEWLASKPDDVEFVRMPAVLGPNWELYGKAYYTAELLGVLDKVHPALFDAIHKDKKKIRDEAALQKLFVKQGVSAEDFRNTFSSFAVNVKLNNAKQMTKRYAITGVPTVIINGKYSTSASQAGSNDKYHQGHGLPDHAGTSTGRCRRQPVTLRNLFPAARCREMPPLPTIMIM